jgi:hypothetical protein
MSYCLSSRTLPNDVGKHVKNIDTALPGKHVRKLYDMLKRPETSILDQLRTGMARLNSYLSRIGAVESVARACSQADESVQHFPLQCPRWLSHRPLLRQNEATTECLSYCLGGKSASDTPNWKPNITAVKVTIKYAMETKRLESEDIVVRPNRLIWPSSLPP